jgi:hypothetical protein
VEPATGPEVGGNMSRCLGDEAAGNGGRRRVMPGLDQERLLVRCSLCGRAHPRRAMVSRE